MKKDAIISDCGKYRYLLRREWSDGNTCLFIMLNPSTADANEDDPTIRRCCDFAKSWGYGAIEVVNLFALRSKDPSILRNYLNSVGTFNQNYIDNACKNADIIVCAWGNIGTRFNRSAHVLFQLRKSYADKLFCLGVTKHGNPKHPLYIPKNTSPVPLTADPK